MDKVIEGLKEVKRKLNEFYTEDIVFYYRSDNDILTLRAMMIFDYKYAGFLSEWKFMGIEEDEDFVNNKLFNLLCRDIDREKWYKQNIFDVEWCQL